MLDIMRSLEQLEADLGLNVPFTRGEEIPIRNCWHFSTDGDAVDFMFYDEEDFIAGMNRTYVVVQKYDIVILAFCLMDTHVHFVLWGDLQECNRFMHEYVRRTSQHISIRHGIQKKFRNVRIDCQSVDTDRYLKVVICYVIKNPTVAGMPFLAQDYPWSSGALYMRIGAASQWTAPAWRRERFFGLQNLSDNQKKDLMRTNDLLRGDAKLIGQMIFPGEYVAFEIVNRIYRTAKSFNYFMGISKEAEVESQGGFISRLSIPYQEMRQNRIEVCKEMYGMSSTRKLSAEQRLRLAKTLRHRYNCSPKQIAKMCGLVYAEVKDML